MFLLVTFRRRRRLGEKSYVWKSFLKFITDSNKCPDIECIYKFVYSE